MASPLQALLSLTAAGLLMFTQPVVRVTPQHNPEDLLLVNRQWRISENYFPDVRVSRVPGQVRYLREEAASALEEMFAACKAETGVQLVSVSGYRPYDKQVNIYDAKLKRVKGSREKADEYVARPGASEHQTGLTMDVGQRSGKNNLAPSFGKTKGALWLRENCWRFGFILRYDEGWEEVTGYAFEPWHIRYVGRQHAARIHEDPMPLEEYLQIVRRERLMEALASPTDLEP